MESMHWTSGLREELKEARALVETQRKTIKGLRACLWIALFGWLLTLSSGIALWQITDKPAPPPVRLMEPDFGWGYNRAND